MSSDSGFKWFIGIFVSLIALGCGVGGCVGCNSCQTEDSVMTGQVMHYGRSGIVFKTNEGSLSKGFTQSGTGTVSTKDEPFCVELGDTENDTKIQAARDSGKPIRVYYHGILLPFMWRCESDQVVYKVEPIEVTK